uniref:unspecific monooxygenase n=1 Tax=Plutella xylostella TaxID=51655 RepID=A0A0A7DGY2_PLUXY|nr:uncharacterized protein LOC105397321 [Plutella xylostella]AIJ00774.1 P450 CYP6 family protein 14 [Plutella xylostella]
MTSSQEGPSYTVVGSAVLSLIAITYLYCRYKLNYWKRLGVESLTDSHWLFGNFKKAILFQSAPGWYLGRLYHQARSSAPFVGFYIFHKPCLLLRDPKIIKQILVKDFETFSDRNFAGTEQKDSIGMRNLFGLRNPAWRYLRTKITPTLTRGKLRQMFPLMLETGEPMIEYIKQQKDKNGVKIIDAQEMNYKFCTDLIASVALGTKTDSFQNPNGEFTTAVYGFFHSFKRMVALAAVFFMPKLVDLIGSPILFNSSFVNKVFWTAVEKREKSGDQRGDYIDSIIQLKNGKQSPLYRFEGENLLFQSGTFFSGFESSSTSAAFTLMELARSETHQVRARQEIQAAVKQHGWTFEAFSEMKFVDQCVLEGVRLHPPVSTIDRCARTDYHIPGTDIVIEKGTAIYISLYGLQEDPKHFENPLQFDPERFNSERIVPEAYLPFGVGPRMCVGMRVGQLHAKVVIALILSRYEIFQTAEVKNELDPRSTFTAAVDGLKLEFHEITA